MITKRCSNAGEGCSTRFAKVSTRAQGALAQLARGGIQEIQKRVKQAPVPRLMKRRHGRLGRREFSHRTMPHSSRMPSIMHQKRMTARKLPIPSQSAKDSCACSGNWRAKELGEQVGFIGNVLTAGVQAQVRTKLVTGVESANHVAIEG